MTGSALALSLCGYFARTQADIEVHAYMALAENLISPTAYKPNEVVVASDGTSIEVVDTDAEGRMVLADTLAFARKGKPDLLIDYATLTGAAIRSLDRKKSAVFSHTHREDLAQLAVRCGDQSGERVWYFPLDADYRKGLKSRIADLLQCSESSNADHIYAATFLSHFVGAETPWVHVDLVACENKGGLGLIGTDTTGFGVLWTDTFVKEFLGQSF
jgi:leucyl aminopeptidase/proline iminopeptidase